jgi:GT2 family glycosyltransferase
MGSNPVLILTHNCLEMTKRCAESVHKQDIPTRIMYYDNGSTDGTRNWLPHNEQDDVDNAFRAQDNNGVSAGWNWGLNYLFTLCGAEHVLCVNNDTVLPSWFLSSLLSYDGPFISGVSVDNMDTIANPEPRKELAPCPDFSAWLMRRECWEKVGQFDESMVLYASDLDYHIRAHRAGVPLMNAGVPFYHLRSSTLNNAAPKERRAIQMQADADRLRFYEKYGFHTWSPEYAAQFVPDNFGVDAK